MDHAPKLGQLIDGDEHRDAVHVAVIPVIALNKLHPGQHICLAKGSTNEAVVAVPPPKSKGRLVKTDSTSSANAVGIGIVDPYLTESVPPGKKFWMFLYPGTITSLRHEWTHPDFPEANVFTAEEESFARGLAAQCGTNYEEFMHACHNYAYSGDHYHMGDNEDYKHLNMADMERFWVIYSRVHGRSPRYPGTPFTCSC